MWKLYIKLIFMNLDNIEDKNEVFKSISTYIYKWNRDTFFINNIELLEINDFFSLRLKKKTTKVYFVDTKFLLSKLLLENSINWYQKLLKLIKEKLLIYNKSGIDIIFDYLPIRFFWSEFLVNNYFFWNFKDNTILLDYVKVAWNKKQYSKWVSIQVLVSRLDFLDDVFKSIINQTVLVKEIYLFINFKDKKDIKLFEIILLKYFKYSDKKLILSYAINQIWESEARVFMPNNSECQYILPLDDDDFLSIDCLAEVDKILNNFWEFSLIKWLLKWVDESERFWKTPNIEDRILKEKINHELTRRNWKFLLPKNIASVDQLYVYNYDLLQYYWNIIPKNIVNNTWIEIELFLKSEEIGWVFLIEKVLYYKRYWNWQVTNNFEFQKELFNYLFDLISKVMVYRNLENNVIIDLFPYIEIN